MKRKKHKNVNFDKKIKIYLQHPWIFPDSPYYKYLLDSPEKNITYVNKENKSDVITKTTNLNNARNLKDNLKRVIRVLKLPIPNVHFTKSNTKFDLIHCAHCLSLNNTIPWIVDLECAWQIGAGNSTKITVTLAKRILSRKNCKSIICWTKETKIKLEELIGTELSNKIEVVYPGINSNKRNIHKRKKTVLLFSARYFETKGGEYALKTMDKLTRIIKNVEGIIVTDDVEKAKSLIKPTDKIKFFPLMKRKELFEKCYKEADIMIYPGLSDSFGYGFLDAMSFGIPIVTVDGYARREIVEDGKNGFVVGENKYYLDEMYHPELEKQLIEKTKILIKDKKLREKMGTYGYNLVKTGRFSLKNMQIKMKKIYTHAVKN